MHKTRLEQMQAQMLKKLDTSQGEQVSASMEQEYLILCRGDVNRPQNLLRHLHNNIFPVAATFRALLKTGMSREEAVKLTQDAFLELMERPAAAIQKLCKIPGAYRLVPQIFAKLMPKLFQADAGFLFQFYPTARNQVKFDMIICPYYQVCQELDCRELAPVFCATDDICYGHMHPRLCWNRTQTLARGGNCCDFDITIKETKKR